MNKLIAILLFSTVTCFGGSKFVRGKFVIGSMPYVSLPSNNLLNSLQAYWKLDETGGGGSSRISQVNNVQTMLSDPLNDFGVQSSTSGKILNCAEGNYYSNPDVLYNETAQAINTTLNWSFGGWAYVNDSTFDNYQLLFSFVADNGSPQIYIAPDQLIRFEKNCSGTGDISTYSYPKDTWIYLTATYNYSTLTFSGYINGTLIGTSSPDIDFGACQQFTMFNGPVDAGYPLSNYSFFGRLDEWGFWNKCLTQTDINNLYNNGNGLPYSSFTN